MLIFLYHFCPKPLQVCPKLHCITAIKAIFCKQLIGYILYFFKSSLLFQQQVQLPKSSDYFHLKPSTLTALDITQY